MGCDHANASARCIGCLNKSYRDQGNKKQTSFMWSSSIKEDLKMKTCIDYLGVLFLWLQWGRARARTGWSPALHRLGLPMRNPVARMFHAQAYSPTLHAP